ncbi:MAG TPA: adenylate/guanylate cyclase domain-containing protein [Pseudolabrys sp.]|nr:adenylate/guanylate cyclase domain-containing protein [Pseudolabrys sp.]
MIRQSIKRQIVSIAVGLIILMIITSALSMVMARKVGHLLDELTMRYIPAYGHLARTDIRSDEGALALRRMIIAKMQEPPDEAGYAAQLNLFQAKSSEVVQEAAAARKLIAAIIEDVSTPSDNASLARIDSRIETAVSDLSRYLNDETAQLFARLDARDLPEVRRSLPRVDSLRDEFNQKIDAIRRDMLAQVYVSTATIMRDQQRAIWISAIVTALAAILGLTVSIMISDGITRPVRRLLEGTRAVQAGQLNGSIDITTRDEIGQLTAAFNRMVEQLRRNERIRETFGKYIDPQIVEWLIDRPALSGVEGNRRVMTMLFCDMKGFTSLSEGVTPQGLVKLMNHYLSTMSAPIRKHKGIIDKYIGDSIMAYWGPPFTEDADQARLACLAAIDMLGRVALMRAELPELLGVRFIPNECDIRIGIATGEVLVGSIGSELMMSYTVMGDTVNLASRLEMANKIYGSHSLVSEATIAAAGTAIEAREIDQLVVVGQTVAQKVFEIIGREGELNEKQLTMRSWYSKGLTAYRARNWDEARRAFQSALEVAPGDGPSMTLLRRIETFEANPPAEEWDGSWQLDHK